MTEKFDIQLLKFADAELSPEEETCVLLDCEQSPELWKDLALALVAERRLTAALSSFDEADDAANSSLKTSSPGAASLGFSSLEASSDNTLGTAKRSSKTTWPASSKWASMGRLCAMSLAVLLAFVAGRYQGQPEANHSEIAEAHPSSTVSPINGDGSINQVPDDSRPDSQNLQPPSLAQPVNQRDVAKDESETLLADTESDEQFPMHQAANPWTVVSKPVISDEDRGVFSEAGLDVEEQNTVYIVSDADGGRWAIPWKVVNVRYSPNP